MEDWITLHLTVESLGGLRVRGQLRDRPGIGNVLTFARHHLDQTDLAPMIRGLDEIDARFPVKGSPDGAERWGGLHE